MCLWQTEWTLPEIYQIAENNVQLGDSLYKVDSAKDIPDFGKLCGQIVWDKMWENYKIKSIGLRIVQ